VSFAAPLASWCARAPDLHLAPGRLPPPAAAPSRRARITPLAWALRHGPASAGGSRGGGGAASVGRREQGGGGVAPRLAGGSEQGRVRSAGGREQGSVRSAGGREQRRGRGERRGRWC